MVKYHMTQEQFLKAVFDTMSQSVDKQSVHPVDIMTAVLTSAETIYNYVNSCPSSAFADYTID